MVVAGTAVPDAELVAAFLMPLHPLEELAATQSQHIPLPLVRR